MALVVPPAVLAAWLWSAISGLSGFLDMEVFDRTDSWPTFHRESIAPVFKLPKEIEIVSVREGQGLCEGFVEVRFRLPRDRKPSEWLNEIARRSGIADYRISGLEYDAGWWGALQVGMEPKMDECSLRYESRSGLYVARYGWD